MTNFLGVIVFVSGDGVTTPADHQAALVVSSENAGVAQDIEHRIGDVLRRIDGEQWVVDYLIFYIDDVPEYREEVLFYALDEFSVDKSVGRGIVEFELNTTVFPSYVDVKIAIELMDDFTVIKCFTAVQDSKGTATKE
jgi:hypothetical protein